MPPAAITVATPTFNPGTALSRLWDSLRGQSDLGFSWLVVDDGSTDGTPEWVEGVAGRSPFPVRLVRHAANRGLSAAVATAAHAVGDGLLLLVGHDDELAPGAVATVRALWDSIPAGRQAAFAGVGGRCQDPQGRLLGAPYPEEPVDTTASQVRLEWGIREETTGALRADVLRRHGVPPLDRWVPASALWRALDAAYLMRCTGAALRVYHRDQAGSMTRARSIRFPRGQAFAGAVRLNVDRRVRALQGPPGRLVARYALDCSRAGIGLGGALAHLHAAADRVRCAAAWPGAVRRARHEAAEGLLDPGRRTGDWDERTFPSDLRSFGFAQAVLPPVTGWPRRHRDAGGLARSSGF